MTKQDFLFEIGCDELPAQFLKKLSHDLLDGIEQALTHAKLSFEAITPYATPRRLAVLVHALDAQQADQQIKRQGPFLKDAYGKDGTPTLACIGFARSCGVSVDQLGREETPKGTRVCVSTSQPGAPTQDVLPALIEKVIKKLPLPKPMRWGNHETVFLRPVQWVVMMLGEQVIECTILGKPTSNTTYGHRFHHPEAITINQPANYADLLEQQGRVVASYADRRSRIKQQLLGVAKPNHVIIDAELLDEVTGLVEWPHALLGHFDNTFLDLPPEVLVTSMKTHQKCFPVMDEKQRLQSSFVLVSNIKSTSPEAVIRGNERVIQARLSDAAFFYQQDCQKTLESRSSILDTVVFQKSLGSIGDKVKRMVRLAVHLSKQLEHDNDVVKRGAQLAKCDLVSGMVFEFPNLQGTMGYYYARHDGESKQVALTIQEHYYPRYAGDQLPSSAESAIVALADRLDTLVGIIGIKQKPTGDKDPFALRRAALGVCRLLIEKEFDIDLKKLIAFACKGFDSLSNNDVETDVLSFIFERLKYSYLDQGITADVFEAVMVGRPTSLVDFDRRIQAVVAFKKLPEAEALAAANKRVSNILKKQKTKTLPQKIHRKYLDIEAETILADLLDEQTEKMDAFYEAHDYTGALTSLACLKEPIDTFFEKVMVMDEDNNKRQNRLALLATIQRLFSRTADISLISSNG